MLNASVSRNTTLINDMISGVHLINSKQDELRCTIAQSTNWANHANHVLDAAIQAHQNSPYKVGNTMETNSNDHTQIPDTMSPTRLFDNNPTGGNSPGLPLPTGQTTTNPKYPVLPATYDSLQMMYDDWNGAPNSVFGPCGGIRAIDNDSAYRRTLSPGSKKFLQKLNRVNRFFDYKINQGNELSDVVEMVLAIYKQSSKKDVSLSGTAEILKKHFGWTGKPKDE